MDAFTRETMQVVNETMGLDIATESELDRFFGAMHDGMGMAQVRNLGERLGFVWSKDEETHPPLPYVNTLIWRQAKRRHADRKMGVFRSQWRVECVLDRRYFGREMEGEDE